MRKFVRRDFFDPESGVALIDVDHRQYVIANLNHFTDSQLNLDFLHGISPCEYEIVTGSNRQHGNLNQVILRPSGSENRIRPLKNKRGSGTISIEIRGGKRNFAHSSDSLSFCPAIHRHDVHRGQARCNHFSSCQSSNAFVGAADA